MIIDVKVDLDWIKEDGSIDEAIREAILSGVINPVKRRSRADWNESG